MDAPVFKEVETENTIRFMHNNTNELSLMNLALNGEYEKKRLNPDEVYEICCYIANGFLLENKNYPYIISDLKKYEFGDDYSFLKTIFLCCETLMDAINFETTERDIKKSIFDLCNDLMDFISERRSLKEIQRELNCYFLV